MIKIVEPRFPFYPPLLPAEISAARARAGMRRAIFRSRAESYPEPRVEPLGRRSRTPARAQGVVDLALAYFLKENQS